MGVREHYGSWYYYDKVGSTQKGFAAFFKVICEEMYALRRVV